MSTEVATRPEVRAETLEKVLLGGNLAVLNAEERMTYYKAVCESVGLNPLTRPFEYLNLNGKLVLYARREATEQLRKIHGVSIGKLEKTFHGDDLYIVEAPASDKSGRTDSSTGAVNIKGLAGEAKANALMKAETKAKRRVTLSICGLGMLDETEADSIPGAVRVPVDLARGEIPEGDDVPAVDLRADVAGRGGIVNTIESGRGGVVMGGGIPTPAPAPITPQNVTEREKPAFQKPSGADLKFYEAMGVQKKRVGTPSYYAVLGLGHGYSHCSEILDHGEREAIWKELKALPDEEVRS